MPAPTTFADLSTTAASNFPAGSDNVFPSLDDTLRVHAACLASILANTGNGWTSPYLPIAGALVWNETGAAVDARFEGDTDANLLFLDGSTDFLGVGTGTPAQIVDISRAQNAATVAVVRNGSAGASANAQFVVNADTTSGKFVAYSSGAGGGLANALTIEQTTANPIIFYVNSTEALKIDGSRNLICALTGTAPTLGTNSTMSFELTSDTSLKIVARGSDGVTRSVSLTLA